MALIPNGPQVGIKYTLVGPDASTNANYLPDPGFTSEGLGAAPLNPPWGSLYAGAPESTAVFSSEGQLGLPANISRMLQINTKKTEANEGIGASTAGFLAPKLNTAYHGSIYIWWPTEGGELQIVLGGGKGETTLVETQGKVGWHRYSLTWTPTVAEQIAEARVILAVRTGLAVKRTFFVAGAMLTEGTSDTAYFDGDTANCKWSGVSGNSISYQGSRAVFNDSTDPDFVGYLTDITGLDSAEVRENADNISGQDGGIHGDFFYGRRPITLSGSMINVISAEDRNEKTTKMLQACNAMRADATLEWTPEGGEPTYVKVRRSQQAPRVTGGWAKDFQIGLVSADSKLYSVAEQAKESSVSAAVKYATGNAPVDIATSWDGKTVYVVAEGSNLVNIYERHTSGALVSIGSIATGTTPQRIYVSEDNQNVYVTNKGSNTVSVYTRNTTTGLLTLLESKVTGEEPIGICASDTTNAYGTNFNGVYIANKKGNSIGVYKRNPAGGALTLEETKALSIGDGPIDVIWCGYNLIVACNGTKQLKSASSAEPSNGYRKLSTFTAVSSYPGQTPESLSLLAKTPNPQSGTLITTWFLVGHSTGALLAGWGEVAINSFTNIKTTTKPGLMANDYSTSTVLAPASLAEVHCYIPTEGKIIMFRPSEITGGLTPLFSYETESKALAVAAHSKSVYVTSSGKNIIQFAKAASGTLTRYSATALSCTNTGSSETFLEITVALDPGASLASLGLTNSQTGETVTYEPIGGPLLGPVTLIFNTQNKTVTTVTGVSAFAGINTSSTEWWALGSGVTELLVSAAVVGSVKVKAAWRNAWV